MTIANFGDKPKNVVLFKNVAIFSRYKVATIFKIV